MMDDDVIMRAMIDLPEEQVQALTEWCDRKHISKTEAVRRALAAMFKSQKLKNREEAFGGWRGKNVDSRKRVENLREEWNR